MRKSRYSEEQIIGMLRVHDASLASNRSATKRWPSGVGS